MNADVRGEKEGPAVVGDVWRGEEKELSEKLIEKK